MVDYGAVVKFISTVSQGHSLCSLFVWVTNVDIQGTFILSTKNGECFENEFKTAGLSIYPTVIINYKNTYL